MAGLNNRKHTLASSRLLNLSKTDLLDILWGVAGRCCEGEELALILDEATIQGEADKSMARAAKWLAAHKAKLDAGHLDWCFERKRKHGDYTPDHMCEGKKPGWVCAPTCQHAKPKEAGL